jgi:sec-independent protein translocase protein TatA
MDIGFPELIVVLVVLLLLFGSTRLPKLARSIGLSAKELRDGFSGNAPAAETQNKKSSKNGSAAAVRRAS